MDIGINLVYAIFPYLMRSEYIRFDPLLNLIYSEYGNPYGTFSNLCGARKSAAVHDKFSFEVL